MSAVDPLEAKLGKHARVLLPLMLLAFLALSAWRMWPRSGLEPARFAGATMGTTYNVTVASAPLTEEQRAAIEQAIARELGLVDRQMSNYRPDSELSRLNASETGAVTVPRELIEVLEIAREVSELSEGAFDVTVAPLIDAWGFGPGGEVQRSPDAATLEQLRAHTGYTRLRVDAGASAVQKAHPQLSIDLSAIAPGYAADRIAGALDGLAQRRYMVEVGGEVRARGRNHRGERWRIAIERPRPRTPGAPEDHGPREIHTIVKLDDHGLATSGDYRQFRALDGALVSHTIDPRTGRPVAHGLASVTVVAADAARADALATAMSVLGPDEGMALAERAELAVLMLVRGEDDALEERRSAAFDRLRDAAD